MRSKIIWLYFTLTFIVPALVVLLPRTCSGELLDNDFWSLYFDGLVVVGTLSAVVVALFGDRIRGLIDPIRLEIRLSERIDIHKEWWKNPATGEKLEVFSHHLMVVNLTPHIPVSNCSVWLVAVESEEIASQRIFAAPRLMEWAPSEYSKEVRSFSNKQIFDFGATEPSKSLFHLKINAHQNGILKKSWDAGAKCQFVFQIACDGYDQDVEHLVEVIVSSDDSPSKVVPKGCRKI